MRTNGQGARSVEINAGLKRLRTVRVYLPYLRLFGTWMEDQRPTKYDNDHDEREWNAREDVCSMVVSCV